MMGCDFHKHMPVGTNVISIAPHFSVAVLRGTGATAQLSSKVLTHLGAAIMRGSDIGLLIPHFSPLGPNTLSPSIWLTSGSKSHFGSSQCLIENKPVAAALDMSESLNLNCGDPIPFPLGYVNAPTSHFVGMTWGDLFAGVAHMMFDIILQYGLSWVGDKLFDGISQTLYDRFLFKLLDKWIFRIPDRSILSLLRHARFQLPVAKGLVFLLPKILGNFFVGSPVGYSYTWKGKNLNLLGIIDDLGKNEKTGDTRGFMDRGYDAIREYIDSPSVETYDELPVDVDAGVPV
jgi:hypothetical protein